jgi:hypothetical protein
MATASLVLGIICLLMSLIPLVGFFFLIPAIVGLILGIVAGGAAGITLNAIAICFIILWIVICSIAAVNQ